MKLTLLEKCEIIRDKRYKYDPITGNIISPQGKIKKPCSAKWNYVNIQTTYEHKKIEIKGHQYAWYMHYGEVPTGFIDHINRDCTDNRIENLRVVTPQQNTFNTNAKGYYYHKPSQKYLARIILNYKQIHIGLFDNENDAHEAYLEAKKIYHKI